MTDYKIHDQDLYDYSAGVYCGVLVTKSAMQKLAKLQAEHLEKVRRVLHDEADAGNVYASSWTLHYPGGNQATVRYIDASEDVKRRIRTATTANQPERLAVVFYASGMDDAKRQADARFSEMQESEVA